MSSFQSSLFSSDGVAVPTADPLGWVMDVPCRVDFVLGSARLKVRDCLDFERHSIVRLVQAAGADVEMRVEGVSIASGEVVIIDENTGLRINRILPPVGTEDA